MKKYGLRVTSCGVRVAGSAYPELHYPYDSVDNLRAGEL